MSKKGSGLIHRKGLTLLQITRMFPDDAAAEKWIAGERWPDGPFCPHCGSYNVQAGIKHRTMTHRCRDCDGRKMFSLKTGTVMEGSKLRYQTWAIAIHLVTTDLQGVNSMKLHRDLGVTQKTAWHLAHRIRESLRDMASAAFARPVEADKTFVGAKAHNMHAEKRYQITGCGGTDRTLVAGVYDRATARVRAVDEKRCDGVNLPLDVEAHAADGATVHTDEVTTYSGLANRESVEHPVGKYVKGQTSIDGMELFWSMLKRGYVVVFHWMSPVHVYRYITEFKGRQNLPGREVRGCEGRRRRYAALIRHTENSTTI